VHLLNTDFKLTRIFASRTCVKYFSSLWNPVFEWPYFCSFQTDCSFLQWSQERDVEQLCSMGALWWLACQRYCTC
jgi:hypothetical protein